MSPGCVCYIIPHFLDVVRDVRAEIAAAQGEFADGHFRVTNIVQHHTLDVVDVVNAEPIELELHHLQKITVETLNQRNYFGIRINHPNLVGGDRAQTSASSVNLSFQI